MSLKPCATVARAVSTGRVPTTQITRMHGARTVMSGIALPAGSGRQKWSRLQAFNFCAPFATNARNPSTAFDAKNNAKRSGAQSSLTHYRKLTGNRSRAGQSGGDTRRPRGDGVGCGETQSLTARSPPPSSSARVTGSACYAVRECLACHALLLPMFGRRSVGEGPPWCPERDSRPNALTARVGHETSRRVGGNSR